MRKRLVDGYKVCPGCRVNKPESGYYKLGGQCKECRSERCHKDYQNNRIARIAAARFRKYGITSEQVYEMLESQGKCCAICKRTETSRGWFVDHDHSEEIKAPMNSLVRVRGILCQWCNSLLGHSKDSPEVLRRAAQYLEVQHVAY